MEQFTRVQPAGDVIVLEGARLVGNIAMQAGVNIWYNTVVRADMAPVTIGENTNVQDNSVLHVDTNNPLCVGKNVTIGHACIMHGCTVGDNTLIGMGSIVMDGAEIGANCIIGAGSLVTQNTKIPDGMMAFGRPAKAVRPLTEEEMAGNIHHAENYCKLALQHKQQAK